MIFLIAWRNIWRNHARSLVVIGSIIVGIGALTFLSGFMNSFLSGYVRNAIQHEFSNIQLHHADFKTDYDIKFTIDNAEEVERYIEGLPGVKYLATRSLSNGMISSAKKATAIQILGVNAAKEARTTRLDSLIAEGSFFESKRRNPIVLGRKLASELQVGIRSKVVLTFQDINNNITAGAFRVVGIVESSSLKINQNAAFIKMTDLNELLEMEGATHEMAVVVDDPEVQGAVKAKIRGRFPDLLVEDWREMSPMLNLMLQWFSVTLRILIAIVMTALVFGIINTMLMSVLERFKELGVLMAIGMNKIKVFAMIMVETILLTLIGGPFGMLAGYLIISYLGEHGIDLRDYSEGLSAIGYDSILYPSLEGRVYIEISIGVVITAFIGAIYPALKAVRLNPVEAISKI